MVPGGSEAPSGTASGDIFSGRRGRVKGFGGGGCGGGEIPFSPGGTLTATLCSPQGLVLRRRRRRWPSRPESPRPGEPRPGVRSVPRRGARSGRGGAESPRSAGEAGRGAGPRPGYGSSCGTRLLLGEGRVEPARCGPRLRALRRPGAGVVTGPAGGRRVFAPRLGGRRGPGRGLTRRIARPPADDPLVLPAESAGGPPPPLSRIAGARARRVPFPRVERRLEVP